MKIYVVSYVGIYVGKIRTYPEMIKEEALRLVEQHAMLPDDVLYGCTVDGLKIDKSKILFQEDKQLSKAC